MKAPFSIATKMDWLALVASPAQTVSSQDSCSIEQICPFIQYVEALEPRIISFITSDIKVKKTVWALQRDFG